MYFIKKKSQGAIIYSVFRERKVKLDVLIVFFLFIIHILMCRTGGCVCVCVCVCSLMVNSLPAWGPYGQGRITPPQGKENHFGCGALFSYLMSGCVCVCERERGQK